MENIADEHSLLYFFILIVFSEITHRRLKTMRFAAASGSILMALGIFSLDALHKLSFSSPLITRLITLEVLIIWLYLLGYFIKSYIDGYSNTKLITNQFNIGTWVAGCSVLAILLLTELPSWTIIIWTISLLALIIWVIYLKLFFINIRYILHKTKCIHIGTILLPTVSTQSIALLLYSLFENHIPILIYQTLIILGILFYLFGIIVIIRHSILIQLNRLILSWSNTNSIIHGALSITGLASVFTHSINDVIIICIWVLASSLFFIIEGISLFKLVWRIKIAGLIKGAFVYDLSQWSRVFTYGMYYAFTLSIYNQFFNKNLMVNMVAHFGQYVVLGIVSIEIFLCLKEFHARKAVT